VEAGAAAAMLVELLELADSSSVSSAVCEEFPELEQRWGFGTIGASAVYTAV
jgi:hypothetical protein